MDKHYIFLYFLSLLIMTTALKIKNILVPDIEMLDENKSVILDCDFDAANDTTDLVVKWFHQDEPIYQWIMNHEPQEVGQFKGKLDLSYKATDDKLGMHRALKIKQLSLDLAGEYKCVVFNFVEEDSMSKKMIIVNGPKKLEMAQLEEEIGSVFVTCSAYDVFPEPTIQITYTGSEEFQEIENDVKKSEDGLFNITQIVTLKKEVLDETTEFTCELAFPDTNFTINERLSFIPGSLTTEHEPNLNGTATELSYTEDNAAVLAPTWIILLTTLSTLLSTMLST